MIAGSFRKAGVLTGVVMIRIYRYTLSPLLGRQCRYLPTCSDYTEQAIRRFGLIRGSWLGLFRILRCNPWGSHGQDEVPTRFSWNPTRHRTNASGEG